MPEYYGYVPPAAPAPNWNEVLGEVGTKITEAFNVRKNERTAFSDRYKMSEEEINKRESFQSSTLENVVQTGANNIRDTMYEWKKLADKGQLTQAKYKERMNTVDQYWKQLASVGKTFDERVTKTLMRQQPNEKGDVDGSGFEAYINKVHSEIANLKNRKIYVNPNTGAIYLNMYDDDGNIVDSMDVRQMNNPGNIIDNRVHLNKAVAENVKNWGDWTTFTEGVAGSSRTVEDARKNPAFINAKNSLVRSIMTNDRSAASVLTDNGSGMYRFYASEGELKGMLQKDMMNAKQDAMEAGIEFNEQQFLEDHSKLMILAKKDESGVYQPILTEDQRLAAKQRVEDEIEIQLGMKESGTVKRAPSSTGGGGQDGGTGYDLYAQLHDAWRHSTVNSKESAAMLTSASGGKYIFEWGKNGLKVLSPSVIDGTNEKGQTVKIHPTIAEGIKSLDDLAPYFYGSGTPSKGTRESFPAYNAEKAMYLKEKTGTKVSKTSESRKTAPGFKSKKKAYTEADIQATMKANPGSTREEVIQALENE